MYKRRNRRTQNLVETPAIGPRASGIKVRTRALFLTCLLPATTLLYAAALPQGRSQGKAAKPATTTDAKSANVGFAKEVLPVVQKYCVSCHTGKGAQAGIDLSLAKDASAVLKERDSWDRVAQNVASGHMPPAGSPAPTTAQRNALVNWVQSTTAAADCQLKDPGHVTLRRLNRAEYNNTMRDLCGVDINPAEGFPNDDVGYGFDNIGDVLSISPLLMEKYVAAAAKVAHAAFQNPDTMLRPTTFDPAPPELRQSEYEDGRSCRSGRAELRSRLRLYFSADSGLSAARGRLPESGWLRIGENADQTGRQRDRGQERRQRRARSQAIRSSPPGSCRTPSYQRRLHQPVPRRHASRQPAAAAQSRPQTEPQITVRLSARCRGRTRCRRWRNNSDRSRPMPPRARPSPANS